MLASKNMQLYDATNAYYMSPVLEYTCRCWVYHLLYNGGFDVYERTVSPLFYESILISGSPD